MDIDTDFQNQYRHVIVEYVQAKYGYDHVSQIVTYNMLGLKSIIRNVGKVLGIPYLVTDELSKNVPKKIRKFVYLEEEDREEEQEIEPTLEDLKTIPFFKERIDSSEDVAQLFKIGKLFDGLPSSTGKHACGVIIGAHPLHQYVGLMEVDGVLVTQFEKKASESIGLLKMDFLGLITLDIEVETLRLIKKNKGIEIDLDKIPLDDTKTFELLQRGQSGKVFQLESQGMRNLLKKMQPTDMSHIIAIAALFRPGPMQFIDNYIEGMKTPSKVKYPHPLYENSAKETFGILVYQEQIMQVVQDMAGFSLGEADILRRGIGKKDKQYIDQMEEEFSKRCVDNGVPEKTAKEVYAMIKKFAEYGFNKSHSAAYALIAYETAYLKAYYPVEFMAANCTINSDNKDKLISCLAEIKAMGIEILPPSIRFSQTKFTVEKSEGQSAIRYGYIGIDGIGEDIAKTIETLSNCETFYDFISQCPNIRNNQITNLIYSGTFDIFGCRKKMREIAPSILETVKYHNQIKSIYKSSILDGLSGEEFYDGTEYGFKEKLDNEKRVLHCCISGHPLEQIRGVLKGYDTLISDIQDLNDGDDIQILCQINSIQQIFTKKSGEPMAFLKIEDEYDFCEAIVFPKTYADIENLLKEDSVLILNGKIQIKEDNGEESISIIVNTARHALSSALRFYVDINDLEKIEGEFVNINGIAEVIGVDTVHRQCYKQAYYVDYVKALNIFNKYKIKFVSV